MPKQTQTEKPSSVSQPLVDDIAGWIMTMTLGTESFESIYMGTCERLFAVGVPLARAHVAYTILHPLYSGVGHTWRRGHALEVAGYARRAQNEGPDTGWIESPFYHVINNRLPFLRRRLTGPDAVLDFPVLSEFRDQGATDYFAFAIPFGHDKEDGMVGSWVTDRPGGFHDGDLIVLRRIQQRIGVACKTRLKDQIAENVVTTYLGPDAGLRVLSGQIRRGDGEMLKAVFWYSDLRGSTALAGRLDKEDFIPLLNSYFEATAGAVIANGGEILSFVGDAVLAVFPITDDNCSARDACASAQAAQADSRERLAALNAEREAVGYEPLQFGIALHLGEAVFGNIGVPERLAFTVIGTPVNEVARIEDMTKSLGEPVLATEAFARHLEIPWRSVGAQELRGVDHPVELFAPPG